MGFAPDQSAKAEAFDALDRAHGQLKRKHAESLAALAAATRRAEAAEAVAGDMATDLMARDSYATGRADGWAALAAIARRKAGEWHEEAERLYRAGDMNGGYGARCRATAFDEAAALTADSPPPPPPAALVARCAALEAALAAFLADGPTPNHLDGKDVDAQPVACTQRLGTYRLARNLLRRDAP